MLSKKQEILDNLKNVIATVYESDSSEVDILSTFLEMGLDSISIIQVKQLVKNEYQMDIPVDRLFSDISNLDKLADFIQEKLPSDIINVPEKADFLKVLPTPKTMGKSEEAAADVFPAGEIQSASRSAVAAIIADQLQVMHKQMDMLSKYKS